MASKNSRRRQEHAARAAYAASKRRYWHGGAPGLEPDTELLGRADAETSGVDLTPYELQIGYDLGVTRHDRVYFTSDREFARGYAGRLHLLDEASGVVIRHGALYQVEPVGPIEPDPDFLGSGIAWCAPRARIIAVEEAEVVMDEYTANAGIGPHMRWDHGTPIYTQDGQFLPSPTLLSAGYTAEDFVLFPAWVSVEEVNARLTGVDAPNHITPERFAGVYAAALPAADVRARRRRYWTNLLAQSVAITGDSLGDLPAVNALVAQVTPAVRANDDRGVVVARHPQQGIIGAAVIEGIQHAKGVTAFVDAVAVTDEWRGRGVGSMLLTSVLKLLPAPPVFTAGRCRQELAPFFTQAGYTVLKPGERMPMPQSVELTLMDPGAEMCWFYRQGEL